MSQALPAQAFQEAAPLQLELKDRSPTCCKRDLSASSQLTTLLKTCISLGTRRLSERSTAMRVSGLKRFSVACVSACSSNAW